MLTAASMVPWRNTPEDMRAGSSTPARAVSVASSRPITVSASDSTRRRAWPDQRSSQPPSTMSAQAPITSASLSPTSGISTCTVSSTPAIAPSVLQAYTWPMARSPWPRRISTWVNSGSVMPAMKVAGSMIAKAIAWLPRLNSA